MLAMTHHLLMTEVHETAGGLAADSCLLVINRLHGLAVFARFNAFVHDLVPRSYMAEPTKPRATAIGEPNTLLTFTWPLTAHNHRRRPSCHLRPRPHPLAWMRPAASGLVAIPYSASAIMN
jgi:hypothetical protein